MNNQNKDTRPLGLTDEQPSGDVHELHFNESRSFDVPRCYDYRRTSALADTGSAVLRTALNPILQIIDRVFLGYSVSGTENFDRVSGGAVTIANHIHPLDCTMVDLALFPHRAYYVTLESNFRIPVVRSLIQWLRAVPMSRRPARMGEMFAEMSKALAEGSFVHFYPEAVLKPYCTELREFHDGAFRLAAKSRVPVVPMYLSQSAPAGLSCYKHKPCLRLEVLSPVYPDLTLSLKQSVEKLKTECRKAMTDAASK